MTQKIEIKLAIETKGAEFKVQQIYKHNDELYIVSTYHDNNCQIEQITTTYEVIFLDTQKQYPIACHYIITDEYHQEVFNLYNRTCRNTVVISDISKIPTHITQEKPLYDGEGIRQVIFNAIEKMNNRIMDDFDLMNTALEYNLTLHENDFRNQAYMQILAQAETHSLEEQYLLAILNDVYSYLYHDETFASLNDHDRIEILERLSLPTLDKAELATLARSFPIHQPDDLRAQSYAKKFKHAEDNAVKLAESKSTLFTTPAQVGIAASLALAAAFAFSRY